MDTKMLHSYLVPMGTKWCNMIRPVLALTRKLTRINYMNFNGKINFKHEIQIMVIITKILVMLKPVNPIF